MSLIGTSLFREELEDGHHCGRTILHTHLGLTVLQVMTVLDILLACFALEISVPLKSIQAPRLQANDCILRVKPFHQAVQLSSVA